MLKLNENERATVTRLLKEWGYRNDEPDCCSTANYHFEVIPSGIGDSVFLCYKDYKEFIGDWEKF